MRVERASVWAEAVFHVLAHVDVGFASSCFSRAYVTWIEARSPGAAERAHLPAFLVQTHDTLARAQALAWVFASAESNRRWSDCNLDEVEADNDDALHIARSSGHLGEVLRATAELEMSELEVLAPPPFDGGELTRALEAVLPAAPALEDFTIAVTPPLGLRGRVLGHTIFTGLPGIAEATAEHVAWQAAHEAAVTVAAKVAQADFIAIEREALARLRLGARRAGLGEQHATWLARLDLRAIGAIPDVDDGTE